MKIEPRAFFAKDGGKVILRAPRWEDLDDLLAFINSLVEEDAEIFMTEKTTRDKEAEWLGQRLASVAKGETIDIVAEVDQRVVANSEVQRRTGPMSHVGYLGISIRRGYRCIGIGSNMMKMLIEESKKLD